MGSLALQNQSRQKKLLTTLMQFTGALYKVVLRGVARFPTSAPVFLTFPIA